MKKILWLEDEQRLLGGFFQALSVKLETTPCRLSRPFTTAADLFKFLLQGDKADRPQISAADTCLLIDIMLPGHSFVQLPEGWLPGGNEERFFPANGGLRAGLVFYREVLLPKYQPPLPVIFLTSVSKENLETDRKDLEMRWMERRREEKGESKEKETESNPASNLTPRVAFITKQPGDKNVEEIVHLLSDWGFCS